jgi:superfamily II RNA helicase
MSTNSNLKYVRVLHGKCETLSKNPALTFPYESDDFQKHSYNCIDKDEPVLVTAHTGCGKTNVAKYAIAHYIKQGMRVVYTSPVKALSNQKYKEFTEAFPEFSIGLMTGDNKINPDAQCVIMTTEILRNALYDIGNTKTNTKKDDYFKEGYIDTIKCVIFDEVHYINDKDRGKVWEETLIMLDRSVNLIMLSATIDKAENFANWIGQNKKRIVNLIPTNKRVIPLEHFIFVDDKLHKVLDKNNNFDEEEFDYARSTQLTIDKERKNPRKIHFVDYLVKYLLKKNLLQSIFFAFSRKNCERYARAVTTNLLTPIERNEVQNVFRKYMLEFEDSYKRIPQYLSVQQLITKGVCFHHSGLLPVLKEIVEILFEKGLVKVLFATETFAVGVNMPARTIVFTEIEKYTSSGRRLLKTSEYKQMAGRAGRRGIDTYGTVILLPLYDFPEKQEIRTVMLGKIPHIESRFYINYSFLLKIIQSNSKNMADFINSSLFNVDTKCILEAQIEKIKKLGDELKTFDVDYDEKIMKLINEYHRFTTMDQNYGDYFIKLSKKQLKQKKLAMNKINDNKELKLKYETYTEYSNTEKQLEIEQKYFDYIQSYVDSETNKLKNVLESLEYVLPKGDEKFINYGKDDVTMKGIIASQINECNPIILTEMITLGLLDDLEAKEIIAMLSIFIDDVKGNNRKTINNVTCSINVVQRMNILNKKIDEIIKLETTFDIDNANYGYWNIFYDYADVAYNWANNCSICDAIDELDTYEGNFMRSILKINNLARDIISLATIYGNLKIIPELEKIEELIVRDIVNASSLYLQ